MTDIIKKDNKRKLITALLCFLSPVYLEIMLHIFEYGDISKRIIYPVLFSMAVGALIYSVVNIIPGKAGTASFFIILSLITLYFEIQLVYHSIFGEFMPLWQVQMGGEAVTNFFGPMMAGIFKSLPKILTLLVPIALSVILSKFKLLSTKTFSQKRFFIFVMIAVAIHFSSVGIMHLASNEVSSVYSLYCSPGTTSDVSIRNIGLISTTRLEAKYLITNADIPEKNLNGDNDEILQYDKEKYNVTDIDFEELSEKTENETLKKLDNYFAHSSPTSKNDHTSVLKGKNLIFLCCESYSPYLVSEDLTPALYRLSNEGYIFNNYYGSFESNTTNGEYTFCMGLLPDLSRQKSTSSFYLSQSNYVPFCLGNMFDGIDADTFAYHNYTAAYYTRFKTHPNMGFKVFKAADTGLDMELQYPSSDLEMIKKSVPDYINDEKQFCVYYMTFSGHYQYNWDNVMSKKNRKTVSSLPYSDTVQAYISCNLELEYALEYLLDELDKSGKADDTVIVLTNDHYPYGLTEEEYNELAGKEVDTKFEKYKNSFICYIPGMREEVDTYCSTVDILPTLLNLFGFEYDSRLLAGKDIFSPEASDYALLSDSGFVTEKFGFDQSSGQIINFTEEEYDTGIISGIKNKIDNQFSISTKILNTNYYAHVFLNEEDINVMQTYTFEDIPVVFIMESLNNNMNYGYIKPLSDTQFGFGLEMSKEELLRAVYIYLGEPLGTYEENREAALDYLYENSIIHDISEETLSGTVSRGETSVILYRVALCKGLDTAVSITYDPDEYPFITEETGKAIMWCFEYNIMTKDNSTSSVLNAAENPLDRTACVYVMYNLDKLSGRCFFEHPGSSSASSAAE